MDLKDKLNLLWKYLFLAVVIVFGILLVCRRPGYYCGDRQFKSPEYWHQMGMPFKGMMEPGKIKVIKEVTDGDTTVTVWVDGKKVDNPDFYLKMHPPGMKHKDCPRMFDDDDDDDDNDD